MRRSLLIAQLRSVQLPEARSMRGRSWSRQISGLNNNHYVLGKARADQALDLTHSIFRPDFVNSLSLRVDPTSLECIQSSKVL
jgi:hypothetical protein